MQLNILFINLLFVIAFQDDRLCPFVDFNETSETDTLLFNGNLYWDMNCKLYPEASYPILDSIIWASKAIPFDTCKITVIESILTTESKSCASIKALEIERYFQNFLGYDKVIISSGRKLIVNSKHKTTVIIEVF